MSDAKKDVMRLISKKQQKNSAYKNRAAKRIGPSGIVLQFIEAVEKLQKESKSALDFDINLDREARLLNDNMKALDSWVELEVTWVGDSEDWKELRVDAVKIIWSDTYLNKNPGTSREISIDMGSLFLEGYLDN